MTIEADFSVDKKVGIVPLIVTFSATVLDGPAETYLWDFGDGITSSESSPTHTYNTLGYHSVTLTVTDYLSNSYVRHKSGLIITGRVSFEKVFSKLYPTGYIFNNTCYSPTGYSFVNWDWNFGDTGLHSTETGPLHIYGSSGYYDVSLGARMIQS